MDKALQCDRCRKCFNPLTVEGEFCHFDNPDIRTCEDYKAHLSGRYLDPIAGSNGFIDLCPDCLIDFITFMRKGDLK